MYKDKIYFVVIIKCTPPTFTFLTTKPKTRKSKKNLKINVIITFSSQTNAIFTNNTLLIKSREQ